MKTPIGPDYLIPTDEECAMRESRKEDADDD